VYIYGSYRKIKTGVPFFLDHPVYMYAKSLTYLLTYLKQSMAFSHAI